MNISKRLVSTFAGLAALAGVSLTQNAEARPMPKGTFTLSAERLTGLSVAIPNGGSAQFGVNLVFANVQNPAQFPRIAADYFVIDGLSLGGSAGISYLGNPSDFGFWGIMPRVGYAFGLSSAIDFWPRLTLGVGGTMGGGPQTYGILDLEAAFIWKVTPNFGVEFGPNFDVLFGGTPGWVAIAGNGGLIYRF